MVSSQPSASANTSSLSYADRARKAQNLKTKTTPPAQRVVSQNAPPVLATSTSLSTSSAGSSTAPSASVSNSSPTRTTGSIDGTPASSAALSARTASRPPSPLLPSLKAANGDVNNTHPRASAPHPGSALKASPAPPTNVWNIRKEQMQARAVSQARQIPPPPPLPTAQKSDQSESSDVAPRLSDTPPDMTSAPSTSTALQNVTNHRMKAGDGPLVNGRGGHSHDDDPFTVRPQPAHRSQGVSPPSVDDTESWPAVGAAQAPGEAAEREVEQAGVEVPEAESSQSTSRKSEKTKWIPIPPEELQAAADALQRNRGHLRNRPPHPRYHGHPPASGSVSASGSGSGPASQGQSRAQSSAGIPRSASHVSSVSHSQAQSRAGSVHSSPRQLPIRKRLPEDGSSRSSRVSRSGSPQPPPRSQPQPPAEFVPRAGAVPFQPASVRAFPDQLHLDGSSSSTAYYPVPAVHRQSQPYHSPRGSGSPSQASYSLSPNMYQHHGAIPVHPPYAGAPYAFYPPYGYGYGSPYMYWPNAVPPLAHPPPHSHSPASGYDLQGVPPPTSIARSPPPGESDAVAGYRDVGIILPAVADDDGRAEGLYAELPERGRRARELSFGSIGLEGGESPGPAQNGTAGGSLGLDVGTEGEDQVVREEEERDRSFTAFSIGVAPGEASPTRSRTHTRSKGGSQFGDTTSAISTSEQSEPEAQAGAVEDGGADVEAKVIDLTDTKWEFGTTKHLEDDAVEGESAAPRAGEGASPSPLINALGMSPGPPALTQEHEAIHSTPPPRGPKHISPGLPPVTIPMIGSAANATKAVLVSPAAARSAMPPSGSSAGFSDEWEVRDYGFGFGQVGYGHAAREERARREREREREAWEMSRESTREFHGRPRRGSYGSGFAHERGHYPGRRGRGGFGGRGYGRNFSRGGGAPQRQQPFIATPPPELDGYYGHPAAAPLTTYIPPAYETYSFPSYPGTQQTMQAPPPLPMPQSPLPYPVDMTRYYLLGQLEYYLSPENMARDFFLRQGMDSRGWISIPLIASFNRVRQLTLDLHLVREVLMLSSLVEVHGDWVRMRQWEQFVLPTAAQSVVVEDDVYASSPLLSADEATAPTDGTEEGPITDDSAGAESSHEDLDGEDDDEEDVVFVLGRDADQSWTTGREADQPSTAAG